MDVSHRLARLSHNIDQADRDADAYLRLERSGLYPSASPLARSGWFAAPSPLARSGWFEPTADLPGLGVTVVVADSQASIAA